MPAPAAVHRLPLPPTLSGTAPGELQTALLALRGQPVEIDASAVVRPSTLGLQVLMSAAASWRADGIAFSLSDVPEPLVQAMETLGLSEDQLGMEPAAQ